MNSYTTFLIYFCLLPWLAFGPARMASADPSDCLDEDTLSEVVECIKDHMPDEDTELYRVPTEDDLTDWRSVVTSMLEGPCTAIPLPAGMSGHYTLTEWNEAGRSYCILAETTDADGDDLVDLGWGTFIVNRDPSARLLSIDIPHPLNDTDTPEEGIAIFQGVNARTFLMAGAHREANHADSPCDEDYHIADAAHNDVHTFHATIEAMDAYDRPHGQAFTSIQFHGMGEKSCGGVDVYITHGSKRPPLANSVIDQLKRNFKAAIPATWDWTVTVPGDTPECSKTGTKNMQGKLLNGVIPEAVCSARNYNYTGRFIHIEQKRYVRSDSVYSYWIDAINNIDYSIVPPPPGYWLLGPNNGELWTTETYQHITWRSQNTTDPVHLALFKDGDYDRRITGYTANDGLYVWKVPADLEEGHTYGIRIRSVYDEDMRDYSDLPFSIKTKEYPYTVLSPNGGETLTKGMPYEITWTSNGVDAEVHLILYKDNRWFEVIEKTTPNDGRYTWFVPTDLDEQATYRIMVRRYTDLAVYDLSDEAFTVVSSPEGAAMTLTGPNGGETLTKGTVYPVTWTSANVDDDIRIVLYKDRRWHRVLTAQTPNDGVFEWTVPADLDENAEYTVQVRGYANANIRDVSDAPFSVATASQPASKTEAGQPFGLAQNSPNPFNPVTTIRYTLPEAASVRLTVYDMLGRRVATLVDSRQGAGHHEVAFDGSTLASGMYLYRIEAGPDVAVRRMLLLK